MPLILIHFLHAQSATGSSSIAADALVAEAFETLEVAFVTDLLAETFSFAADFFSNTMDSSLEADFLTELVVSSLATDFFTDAIDSSLVADFLVD